MSASYWIGHSSRQIAAMNNVLVIEFHAKDVEWWDDLVDGGSEIENGFIHLTDVRPRSELQRRRRPQESHGRQQLFWEVSVS